MVIMMMMMMMMMSMMKSTKININYICARLREFSDRCRHLVTYLDLEILDPDVQAVDDHKGSEVLNPSNVAGSEKFNPLVDSIPKTSLLYWSPDRFHLSPEGYDLLGTDSSYFHHDIVLIINHHRITT